MRKTSQKVKTAGAIMTLIVAVSLPIMVFASSYTSTLDLLNYFSGSTRSYVGANINYEATTVSDLDQYPAFDQNYYVTLYRDVWGIDEKIGQVTCPANGASGVKTWTNVGSGNYYFYFSKQGNNRWIESDDVQMYN